MTLQADERARRSGTLVELLRRRALEHPDRPAYVFLEDGETKELALTYGELDLRARAIGAWLEGRRAAGERALLIYPPGLEYVAGIFGCLYAGVVAVPAYPPRQNRPDPRLAAIASDAEATLLLATRAILDRKPVSTAEAPLATLQWLATDEVEAETAASWRRSDLRSDTLAFLQYTSGSTAAPKGVMLSHGDVLENEDAIRRCFGLAPESRVLSWLPPYHDMGLIGGILQPLYLGSVAVLFSPAAFYQRPVRWLRAISRCGITTSGGPNFAYELCVEKVGAEERTDLDLSRWSVAFNGAEPIRQETLERFAAAFAPSGFRREAFYPCYGLAEATLFVSGGSPNAGPAIRSFSRRALAERGMAEDPRGEEDLQSLVGCGQGAPGTRVVVVDPEARALCPAGRVGEVWVSGSSVARGYWRRPEQTAHTLQARLADGEEGPFLRTGDLGFLSGGELFITGRLKDLIIIRGRNYHAEDIEKTVEASHPVLRRSGCAAVSVEADGQERLVVLAEVERHRRDTDLEEVVAAIRQAVAELHQLEVYAVALLRAGRIPKTSSGKTQRHVCRAGFLARTLDALAEWHLPAREREPFPPPVTTAGHGTHAAPSADTVTIQAWMIDRLAKNLGVPPREIDPRRPFTAYGLGSAEAVSLTGDLERWLGRRLSPTLVYEHATVEALARFLAHGAATAAEDPETGARTLERVPGNGHTSQPPTAGEPIAIIGLACRFPRAADPESFWRLLREGVDAITEVPPERWDLSKYYDPNLAVPGKMNTRWGGFLGPVDGFDARFFGISPLEARGMDPQQRLLLEVAWEALEDAGQDVGRLAGASVGAFIGISTNDYGQLQLRAPRLIDIFWSTNNALSIAANRLSYVFDFRGPSLAVDTACSSSLVAVHLACQSLGRGESSLALAGGVNLILSPAISINFSQGGAMSPEGRCRAFDASASGIVRGEGAGIVVLKPLSRALADGDPIRAVIRGSAVNQDGATNGIVAPSARAQSAVLQEAYRTAGVPPEQVHYVEAHGTGTFLGDPIEAKALGAVVGERRRPDRACLLGSVKANLGHLEAAAGVAGLIKTVLCLEHREIPASLHFREPNPNIPFDALGLRVPRALEPWPGDSVPAVAGVSAFGFGGTNAHVVVEEAPRRPAAAETKEETTRPALLLPLSARRPEALRALAEAWRQHLAKDAEDRPRSLRDLCYTAGVRRSHHDHRLAVSFRSREELSERLASFLAGKACAGVSSGTRLPGRRPKLVFVFAGQGAQWWGMGRQLLQQEPVFRAALLRCDEGLRPLADWSLVEELGAEEGRSRIDHGNLEISQTALFALQVALAALWESWGVKPDVVVGHSMGEVAAARVAGILSLPDALRVIVHRGRLMEEGLQRSEEKGAMAIVRLSLREAEKVLAGYVDRLSVAAQNGPRLTVLSGQAAALGEVLGVLKGRQIAARLVPVPGAGHCPQVEPLRRELVARLSGLEPRAASIPIVSSVTGRRQAGDEFDAAYWGRNLREPVRFAEAVDSLAAEGHDTFLELSPDPLLANGIVQCLRVHGREAIVLASLRRPEEDRLVMLGSLGALYTSGQPVDFARLYPEPGRCVRLPSYPWQRERFWLEGREIEAPAEPAPRTGHGHPLLGRHLQSAVHPGTHFWETDVGTSLFPYLRDHGVQGAVVLPAAAYVEMALAAAHDAYGAGTHGLEEVGFIKALFLPEGTTVRVQLVIAQEAPEAASFQVFSPGSGGASGSWTLHAAGRIRLAPAKTGPAPAPPVLPGEKPLLDTIRSRCPERLTGAAHYRRLGEAGAQYGPSFQGVRQLWRREGEALGELGLPASLALESAVYELHPALLDACFQVLAGTVAGGDLPGRALDLYLPSGLRGARVHARPPVDSPLWVHALLRSANAEGLDGAEGDVLLLGEGGQLWAEMLGLRLQRLERAAPRIEEDPERWLYQIRWAPQPGPSDQPEASGEAEAAAGRWILFADRGRISQQLKHLLEARGASCSLVFPGATDEAQEPGHYQIDPARREGFDWLLAQVLGPTQPSCRGIVHLWSLDAPPPSEVTLPALEQAQDNGCGSVVNLLQALGERGGPKPQLWLVTAGAQAVGADTEAVSVAQAPLWGLGKVIHFEHPELRCRLVDLSPSLSPEDVKALVEDLYRGSGENQVAYRRGERNVPRLARYSEAAEAGPREACSDVGSQSRGLFPPDGTYLITGGLGGLGLTLAHWLVLQGARHLALLGRSGATPAAQESLEAMKQNGAQVSILRADVTDERQMREALARIEQSMPPLRGIVHTAAHLDDALLMQLDRERLRAVLAPKVIGAWNLHTLTREAPLDFFVLFSSAASVLGSPGQGNYVAANAFLDALAHHRRTQGLPALSVNWGPWATVGGAARLGRGGRLALRGFGSIPPEDGLKVLEKLLRGAPPQVGVMPVDWSQVRRFYPMVQRSPLLSLLVAEADLASPSRAIREALLAAAPAERRERLQSYLIERIAAALGAGASAVDAERPLNTLGLDSLMALELKNRIEFEVGVTLPMVKLIQGPTVAEITSLLVDQLARGPATLEEALAQIDGSTLSEMLAELERMSEEDAQATLAGPARETPGSVPS